MKQRSKILKKKPSQNLVLDWSTLYGNQVGKSYFDDLSAEAAKQQLLGQIVVVVVVRLCNPKNPISMRKNR